MFVKANASFIYCAGTPLFWKLSGFYPYHTYFLSFGLSPLEDSKFSIGFSDLLVNFRDPTESRSASAPGDHHWTIVKVNITR